MSNISKRKRNKVKGKVFGTTFPVMGTFIVRPYYNLTTKAINNLNMTVGLNSGSIESAGSEDMEPSGPKQAI